jgi:hypothetical protein
MERPTAGHLGLVWCDAAATRLFAWRRPARALDPHSEWAQCARVTSAPNPAISGEAVRRALGATEADAANHRDVADEQAALDEAELHELERTDYYPDAVTEPGPAPATEHRTFLDRVFRRPSR